MFHLLRNWGTVILREAWTLTREAAGEAIGKTVVEETKEKIFKDTRAELLEDLRQIPAGERQNILRRHREAISASRENRFITLLCKIPQERRQDTLKYLDRLSDEEFEQMLYLLEHDVLPQALRRLRRGTIRRLNRLDRRLAPLVRQLRLELEQRGVHS